MFFVSSPFIPKYFCKYGFYFCFETNSFLCLSSQKVSFVLSISLIYESPVVYYILLYHTER